MAVSTMYAGIIIISVLLLKFYDNAHEINEDALEYFDFDSEVKNSYILDISLIRALRANLEASKDDQFREKELLQFLCAITIIKFKLTKIYYASVMFFRKSEEEGEYSAASNEGKTESSGSSIFASASTVDDSRDDSGYHESPQVDSALLAIAKTLTKVQELAETYNQSKIIYLLRKFGIAFGSVEEMLKKEGDDWCLTKKDMEMVNLLLPADSIFPMAWKWAVKWKTVFPLVFVDKCEVEL